MKKTCLVAASLLLTILHTPLARADGELPPPIVFATNFLQLSAEQTRALVTMIQSRDSALQPIVAKIHASQEALARELESPGADALTAGRLLVEIHAGENQAATVARDAAAAFENVLRPDQRDRLQFLRQAARIEPAIQPFKVLGLL